MAGERQTKRSCPFCQHDDRDMLEQNIVDGIVDPKILDKDMGWRANTAERHMKNHAGSYHEGANHSCVVCTSDNRSELEVAYFEGDRTTEDIATELDCSEQLVYRHMKHHFQPLVQKTAALEIASFAVGNELDLLRTNAERLNGKLTELLDEGTVHEDGFVRDAVMLHKEVRETVKDLLRFQEQWGPQGETQQVNQTFNILQVELGKESPETWAKIKSRLQENMGVE